MVEGVLPRVLIVGVYLADGPSWVEGVASSLARCRGHAVTQRWTALWSGPPGVPQLPQTVGSARMPAAKFDLLNRMLGDADAFDWVIVVDDDILVPEGWLDRFLDLAARFDFALSQPARTPDSYIDHPIVARAGGLLARRTRFVEIGPVFCIRRDALPLLVPFEAEAGMGWGLDFLWPVRLEAAGKRLGIVDGAPVAHALRPPAHHYAGALAARQMERLLGVTGHLSRAEAFTVLEAHAEP